MNGGLAEGQGVGFGYAATLVQLHLGVGILLLFANGAASSSAALQRTLGSSQCGAALKAAAAAAGPAPLLAVFALVQGTGAPADLLTWVGLLAATGSLMLSVLLVLLSACFDLEKPIINARTGDIYGASMGDEETSRAAPAFATLARLLNCLRTFGQVLLLFSALPSGIQLLCATAVTRLAIGVHTASSVAGALAHALGGAGFPGAQRDLEGAVAAAPLLASLALMDYMAFGSSSAMFAAIDPSLHSVFVVVAQLALLAVRMGLNGGGAKAAASEKFDLHYQLNDGSESTGASAMEGICKLFVVYMHAIMAVGVVRVLTGVISVSISKAHLSVEWGEPLLATASLLAGLLVAVYGLEMAFAKKNEPVQVPPEKTNGVNHHEEEENGVAAEEPAAPAPVEEGSNLLEGLKGVVLPGEGLLPALLLARAQAQAAGDSTVAGLSSLLAHGLLAAAWALAAQGGLYLLASPPVPARLARLLLALGLGLGLAGLGLRLWAGLLVTLAPLCFVLLPAQARAGLKEALSAIWALGGETTEAATAFLAGYMNKWQSEQMARRAQAADAMAEELANGDKKNGIKGVKGSTAGPEPKVGGGKAHPKSKSKATKRR